MPKQVRVFITGLGGPAGSACAQILSESCPKYILVGGDMDSSANFDGKVKRFYTLPPANDESYIKRLKSILKKEKIDVCIPTVDEELVVLVNHIDEFKDTKFPIDTRTNVLLSNYKNLFYSFLELNGFFIPRTSLVDDIDDLDMAIADGKFPAIFKPLVGRGGAGLVFLENEEQAFALYKNDIILFQEKIEGDIFLVSALFDEESNLLASITHKRTRTKVPNSGTATGAITVRDTEISGLGISALKRMKARGLHGIELMRTKRGRVVFMENNPRLCGQSYLSYKAGINFPKLVVKYLMGDKIKPLDSFKTGLTFQRVFYDMVK